MSSLNSGFTVSSASALIGARTYLQGQEINHDALPPVAITEIGLDSSKLAPGALFAALPGTRTHGANYAVNTAAAAILTDAAGLEILQAAGETRPILVVPEVREVLGNLAAAFYGNPSADMVMIGITGTSGKTTTSYLVEAGLKAAGYKVGIIGTTGTRIAGQAVPTSLTTPEAPTLQKLFAEMKKQGVTHVVMEVSSHALSLGRVQGTEFDIAGFTNLSQDHLDFHRTMEEYFQAKSKLFAAGSPLAAKKAVIVVDDKWGQEMSHLPQNIITVSTTDTKADIKAKAGETALTGEQDFRLIIGNEAPLPVHLPIPGRFNIANAALAIGIATAAEVDLEAFIKGIGEVSVPGRMQRVDLGQEFIAVVDYAHKPAAVAEVLDTLRAQVNGRVGIVLGAGGNRDQGKRPKMGKEAALRADLVIITDDNPRDEDPLLIREAVNAGAQEALANANLEAQPEIRVIGDRAAAITELVAWARPGDAVIIAGKGHETGQLIKGISHHFDDREELQRALQAAGFGQNLSGEAN
ncbi:UDP-N-acetylmuramoyl-L-alanyl-D-glutamate--2,6-diaminopimelate ligase [Corynebacterium caspium]|uniref:UDP-N-acetylmuramoyl-L-alanyl-D-glutamate--2, 6-diaminopimelate ligase n=1 Tax=Corynebacterium caspium TaxID=234828 RepID=UPI00036A89AC|nr:UDP-N-acetylmuramoyl-L-alanyl-D-glutamate--2,6-diaminopimelate ligase [Corynebacterium caspium]WKD58991.1 UDP-N-acetylmuramoyl-L-alanyl-D-glutamate--2,6-diaminopimelate ligase [Corynebacterium caspium DSM 44850]